MFSLSVFVCLDRKVNVGISLNRSIAYLCLMVTITKKIIRVFIYLNKSVLRLTCALICRVVVEQTNRTISIHFILYKEPVRATSL